MNKIIPVAVAVIYDHKTDKFLLTQRKEIDSEDKEFGHCWNFPGGGIQFGEKIEEGLAREMKEELGVTVKIISPLPKVFSPIRHKWQGVLLCYLCELENKNSHIVLNHESIQYQWFTLEEIKTLKTLPLAHDIAKMAHDLIHEPSF